MLIPLLLTVSAAAQEAQITDEPVAEAEQATEIDGGMASYYGDELAGNRTASGERFDPDQLTGAHRSLPFGSMVRVTNVSNGDSVVVRINDRGPFSRGRVIDISHAAARQIGMHRSGTARVKLALLNND
ncbi:MAG TPA: septal ring lytic transglycosylase RlpA family protein [Sphingopyxis sp.]|uniref:septal ring lytic transglycosylase RlpA family protein n=1 Tax=Sphingopyxis sp. TaxID=1908224 RepID=UPI002E342661|nr:septal ring lytic transglycosylase RlpA family protein [Sphingopyxis sp.]HEX2811936.1 septal ring lytic transglycosylase RlpA family protein [Sphingopyxis sp.]